jgi:hypothetical protein
MIHDLVTRWFHEIPASDEYRRRDFVNLLLILGVGVVIRFWGLDNVGLHGDEETMAMPAMAILENGQPILPSGMYYARALMQIYLMSGSVWFFGESEWALRLPSAIVGSFTGLAAFFMGRRFLAPHVNLAFVATIVLLPSMIEVSQTARMYVFFVTCAIWFGACLVRWERDQRISSLILALIVWVLCLHFQNLAIFAAPLFLFPGLSRGSLVQLVQGAIAFVIGGISFFAYDIWISSKYPSGEERPAVLGGDSTQSAIEVMQSSGAWLVPLSLLLIGVVAIVLVVRLSGRGRQAIALPVGLLLLGLTLMAVLQYHLGVILFAAGAIFWLRTISSSRVWLIVPILLAITMTAFHIGVLHQSGLYPGRKLFGALVGTPSVWPILRFLQYSPVAGAIYGLALLVALRHLALRKTLPIHFLYFAIAVWIPLLIIGFFAWDIPPRYAQGQLGYFLLCTFAGVAFLATELGLKDVVVARTRMSIVLLLFVCGALINPVGFMHAVNPNYGRYPDHKGAAEYINSLDLPQETVLIAEDILQQTYYLGHVDYWLREKKRAYHYSIVRNGKIIDQYTGTETLGTGEELSRVLDENIMNGVYVIGSGENFNNGDRMFRWEGIADVLSSDRLRVVYTGRDGKTKIWKLWR